MVGWKSHRKHDPHVRELPQLWDVQQKLSKSLRGWGYLTFSPRPSSFCPCSSTPGFGWALGPPGSWAWSYLKTKEDPTNKRVPSLDYLPGTVLGSRDPKMNQPRAVPSRILCLPHPECQRDEANAHRRENGESEPDVSVEWMTQCWRGEEGRGSPEAWMPGEGVTEKAGLNLAQKG